MTEATQWPCLLATALRLGLSPTRFWRLSLREWRALVGPVDETLTRAAFDMLAQRFPDEQR